MEPIAIGVLFFLVSVPLLMCLYKLEQIRIEIEHLKDRRD